MVKSFAKRYGLDLSLHHNNIADEIMALVVASGAVKGRRVMIAKANTAETKYTAETVQAIEQRMNAKKR